MHIPDINIGGFTVSAAAQPLIIAEIGNNHDGSREQALKLIHAAAEAGADAVKFQTYTAENLVKPDHELYDFFSTFALPRAWHAELKAAAEEKGMLFLSSPFDPGSLEFLAGLGVAAIKIASSDLTNRPLLRSAGDTGLPVLLSTGMANLREIGLAVETLHMAGTKQVVIMQCESRYPAPVETANISLLCEFQRLFKTQVGFSDHSLSIHLPVAATAICARVIEKHFTLSRALDGPDHAVALEPDEFRAMAQGCREAVAALGDRNKTITPEIEVVRKASLRGLYARRDLKAGEVLAADAVAILRPAAELTVESFDAIIGTELKENVPQGAAITRKAIGRG